ncbi:hypothetical protein HHI36_017984 [Cryptolaemus montrouzieri]|uniref:Uncharacterized protein n=1 Tax=Cryptolaemus montrouzieri TaxID=559131 RepID=A0ABD2NYL4_9CUCU
MPIHNENQIPAEKIIAQIDTGITTSDIDDQNSMKTSLTQSLKTFYTNTKSNREKPKNNNQVQEYKKTKKFIQRNPQITVTKADKCNKTVILDMTAYKEEMNELLSNTSSCRKIKRDLTVTIQKEND